jgi:hypothetical protein
MVVVAVVTFISVTRVVVGIKAFDVMEVSICS